jgi:cytochrome c-type biogenesis protein CcmH/NrfF
MNRQAAQTREFSAQRFPRRPLFALVGLITLGALSLASHPSWADEPPAAAPASAAPSTGSHLSPEENEREAESIARSIMSPFCPGRTVSACPVAGPWRADIRQWVIEGVDPDEIKARLAARVPQHNLMGVPGNRLGWVLPVGAALLAVGTLIFLMRYLVRPRAMTAAAAAGAGAAPKGAGPLANGDANSSVVAGKKPENWDERLDEELDTLENDS